MKNKITNLDDFESMPKEHAQVICALRLTGCTWGRISEIMKVVTGTQENWGQFDGKLMTDKAIGLMSIQRYKVKHILPNVFGRVEGDLKPICFNTYSGNYVWTWKHVGFGFYYCVSLYYVD